MKYSIQNFRLVFTFGLVLSMFLSVVTAFAQDASVTSMPTLMPRTSALHHKIVDDMISATISKGIKGNDSDFCKVADDAFVALPLDSRVSFAWNAASYKGQIDMGAITGANKDLFEMTQKTLDNSNIYLDSLVSKNESNKFMLSRSRALTRSALVEMLYESRKESPDTVRLSSLYDLYTSSLDCTLSFVPQSGESKKAYDSLGETKVAYATFWDSKKSELGISPSSAPEPLSISLKKGMMRADTMKEVTNPDTIQNKTDLESFAYTILSSNQNIKTIKITEDKIEIAYTERAKLFGFIPFNMNTKVSTDDSKEVMAKAPWYRFLVSRKMSGLSADDFSKSLLTHLPDSGSIKIEGADGSVEATQLSVVTKMTLKQKGHALEAMSETIANAYKETPAPVVDTTTTTDDIMPESI
jgi:hypothetical protein